MAGGHHPEPVATGPQPAHMKLLANRSGLCPPGFHYTREIWYPHGGFYPDPKGWRTNTALVALGVVGTLYLGFLYSSQQEIRHRAPQTWIPSMLWNSRVPNPVDLRGRQLDRHGKLPAGDEEH